MSEVICDRIPQNLEFIGKSGNIISLSSSAREYLKAGFSLVPLIPKTKKAKDIGWTSDGYEMVGGDQHWELYSTDNIGVNLGKSGLLSLDIDNKEGFLACMTAIQEKLKEETGCEVPFWNAKTAGIKSGNPNSSKRIFRVPDGCPELEPRKITWRSENKYACVFELRCGNGMQDVLPPSVYPKKNPDDDSEPERRYKWIKHPDAENVCILDAPGDLIYLWTHWKEFQPIMEKANPDYQQPVFSKESKKQSKQYSGPSYIEIWMEQQNLSNMLVSRGYKQKGSNRFLSPYSNTGTPGIMLNSDGTKFFSFHQSDPFGDGRQHDAFDVLSEIDYNGNKKAAYYHVLEDLGVEQIHGNPNKQSAKKDNIRPIDTAKVNGDDTEIYRKKTYDEAVKVYFEGDAMEYILKTCQETHRGDYMIQKGLVITYSDCHVLNSLGLHIKITGEKGTGKSHVAETVLKTLPDGYWMNSSMSDKALLFDDALNDHSVIMLDDYSPSGVLQGLLKNSTTDWRRPAEYKTTVKEGGKLKTETYHLPCYCPVWFVKVDDGGLDEQMLDRFLHFASDNSLEQQKRIREGQNERAMNPDKANDTYRFDVCKEIWKLVQGNSGNVVIPYAKDIQCDDYAAGRDYQMFIEIIYGIANLNKPLRLQDENGATVAEISDFEEAAELMNRLITNICGSQKIHHADRSKEVLEYLSKKGTGDYLYQEIMGELGLTNTQISFALNGRPNKEGIPAGLLSICPAITIDRMNKSEYDPEAGESKHKWVKYIHWDLNTYNSWIKKHQDAGIFSMTEERIMFWKNHEDSLRRKINNLGNPQI